jgi:anaerobic ribonucleoside-triphosphate reductase
MSLDYEYLGDFSATPVWHTRHMVCHECKVSWGGCWDNFECPKCGNGDIPSNPTIVDLKRIGE